MARIDWIEDRLQNWARWCLTRGSGVLGYASVNLQAPNLGTREPYADAPVPVLGIEAAEMDGLVAKLPDDLRRTVVVWYLGGDGKELNERRVALTLREKLARLGCAERTLHERVDRAQRMLADRLLERQAAGKAERERVDGLVRQAVPSGGFTHRS